MEAEVEARETSIDSSRIASCFLVALRSPVLDLLFELRCSAYSTQGHRADRTLIMFIYRGKRQTKMKIEITFCVFALSEGDYVHYSTP